jgi:hypothetical protein
MGLAAVADSLRAWKALEQCESWPTGECAAALKTGNSGMENGGRSMICRLCLKAVLP